MISITHVKAARSRPKITWRVVMAKNLVDLGLLINLALNRMKWAKWRKRILVSDHIFIQGKCSVHCWILLMMTRAPLRKNWHFISISRSLNNKLNKFTLANSLGPYLSYETPTYVLFSAQSKIYKTSYNSSSQNQ